MKFGITEAILMFYRPTNFVHFGHTTAYYVIKLTRFENFSNLFNMTINISTNM